MLTAWPADRSTTSMGPSAGCDRSCARTTHSAQAFSPTTTGKSLSRIRLRSGSAWSFRYVSMSVAPCSSSVPTSSRTVWVRFSPELFSAAMASSACTSGPLSSAAPRPHTAPLLKVAANGGTVHSDAFTGCRSPCTTRPSTGAPSGPGSSTSVMVFRSRTTNPSSGPTRASHRRWAASAASSVHTVGKAITSVRSGLSPSRGRHRVCSSLQTVSPGAAASVSASTSAIIRGPPGRRRRREPASAR